MAPLHRHQLIRLSRAGWDALLAQGWEAQAHDCLTHWSTHGLPLVVTRQAVGPIDPNFIAGGLPAPARWGRRRLALQVLRDAVVRQHEFPESDRVPALLDSAPRKAVVALNAELAACHATAHVFGSFGWQLLTGLDHVRSGSDLDLWVAVDDAAHADTVASLFQSFAPDQPAGDPGLHLDGELVFRDGSAVAWREWAAWRAGNTRALIVKRFDGVTLNRDAPWCAVPDGVTA